MKKHKDEVVVNKLVIDYDLRKCLLCGLVHVKSWFISLREKSFFLCENCRKELHEAIK